MGIASGGSGGTSARRQASILRAVLGVVDTAIAFKDLSGRYLGCNREFERAFGIPEAELIGRTDAEVFGPEEAALMEAEDREVVASRSPMRPERRWAKVPFGLDRLFERRKLPLLDEDGEPFGVAALWRDVGDEALNAVADTILLGISRGEAGASSASVLAQVADGLEEATGSSIAFFLRLGDGGKRIVQKAFSRRTLAGGCGLDPSEGHGLLSEAGLWAQCVRSRRPVMHEGGDEASPGLPPGHVPVGRALFVPVLRGEEVEGVLGVGGKPTPYNAWDLALCSRVLDFAWEIYGRILAQEKEREEAAQRDLAIWAMRVGVEGWDLESGAKEYDESWAGILGYKLCELPVDRSGLFDELCHPDDRAAVAERLAACVRGEARYFEAEFRMRHRDGRWLWMLGRGRVVQRAPDGSPRKVSALMIDVSQLKETQERLRAALDEKDVLLQELFHRTKNSMQLINAMLELKRQELDSPEFSRAIGAVQGKIIAMALVQEKLYRNGDLSVLDLGDYIGELVELMRDGEPSVPPNVAIASSLQSVSVSIDSAIPCGIIVSELVSNSIVHAFPEGGGGRVDVAVSRDGDDIEVSVSDDGVGLPSGFDPRSGVGLGLRTVLGIGEEQLHGRVEFGSAPKGLSCRLVFRDVYYSKRL